VVRRKRAFGLLAGLLAILVLVLPATAGAIAGPAGQGDASSAQYAPFLGGRGGPLKGPYTPPVLDPSSPAGFSGWLLVAELGGAALLLAGGALAMRERLRRDDRALVGRDPGEGVPA
jgi:hypothetical protein